MGRCGKQKGEPEDVSVERYTAIEVVDRDKELTNGCVGKIHLVPLLR
jgi:hypothetical protein